MAKGTNEALTLKKLHTNIELKKIRLEQLAEIVGKKTYPKVQGKRLRIYLNEGSLELKCVGYGIDDDGEVILALQDDDGEPFYYRRKNLHRYEITP